MSDDPHMLDRTPYPEWWHKGKLGRPNQLREFIHDLLCERDRLRAALSVARSPRDLEAQERSWSECSRCGDKDDPRRTTCLRCGGQTQVFADGPEPEGLSEEQLTVLFDVLDRFSALTPNGVLTEETHAVGGILIWVRRELQARLAVSSSSGDNSG